MKKKFLITLFTIVTTFLLSGCGNRNLNDNTESEEIITEDVVTTINVEITPPLLRQDGEVYEPLYKLIDFSLYNENYTAYRFYEFYAEDNSLGIFKEGVYQIPVTKVAQLSNDDIQAEINENEEISISFESGSVHGQLVSINDKYYILFVNDSHTYIPLTLESLQIDSYDIYTGISLTDFAKHTNLSEEEITNILSSEEWIEENVCVSELTKITNIISDWDYFQSSIDFYVDKEDTLLPEEYVNNILMTQREAEALKREENENKMREMGAIKINYSQEVYETEEELSDEALKELQAKGSVSDFGLQIKYAEDGTFEYIPGYTIAYYTLEDGTPVLANKEERSFITEDNTKYYLVCMDFNDEYTAIWVLEEEKYNSYSQK